MLSYGVLSDTHGRLQAAVFEIFRGVRRIYHCGDSETAACAADLEALAPVRIVSGNMDHWSGAAKYPEQVVEEVEFGTVAMYHGTRYGHHNGGIVSGLLTRFASMQPRLILFGHSHIPLLEDGADGIVLNPGSASFPRYNGPPTVALVEYDEENDKLTARHIEL